jgi:NADH-quinone oxidoreductase subunit M
VAWTRARNGGGWDFDFDTMTRAAQAMSPTEQAWVLFALLAGFAVKVPLFPFHTWLPLAHTEAPTAGSVILAGVLLKLGTYGIYRFAIPFCPVAAAHYAPLIATVSIIGILYGGLICWVQTDVKKLVAYSSVAHLGFCILGMFSFNTAGLSGSVLYMINHGLSTGALFLLIGMIYERYHTRSMKELGGLAATMPVWATFMVFFAMASVGLPGLNGFVSEFLCLLGAFQAGSFEPPSPGASGFGLGPWYAFIAGTGMIVAAMYLLFMVGKVVWGGLVEPHGNHGHSENAGSHGTLPRDLNAREVCILLPLALACLALGVYPKPLLDSLKGPVNAQADTVARARERAVHRMSAAPARTPEEAPR